MSNRHSILFNLLKYRMVEIDCFEIIFLSHKMNSIFKNKILLGITQHEATRPKRRPLSLDPSEAIDCLFKLVRTGMQWRELQPKTASYITVFKHTRRWIQSGIVHDAYASLLQQHVRNHPSKHYIVDSTYVKNAFGRDSLGRNPVDRGRKAIKMHSRIRTALCTTFDKQMNAWHM